MSKNNKIKNSRARPLTRAPLPRNMVVIPRSRVKNLSNGKLLSFSDFVGNQPISANITTKNGSAAVAYGKTMKSKMQKINNHNGTLVVSHRELIEPALFGSSTFTNQLIIPLNPGLDGFSTWLSEMAKNYEQYEFEEVSVQFITRTSTSTPGSIGICVDYDPTDPPPIDEIAASQMPGTTEGVVWRDLTVAAKSSSLRSPGRPRFVRSGPVLGDLKNFDTGKITVYTNDCSGAIPLGKVWLSYRLKLMIPQSSSSDQGQKPSTCTMRSNAAASQTGITDGVHWNVVFPVNCYDPLGFSFDLTHSIFTPPAGAYRASGSICIYRNGVEGTQFTLRLYKNGEPVDAAAASATTSAIAEGETEAMVQLKLDCCVEASGTDSFKYIIYVEPSTGAEPATSTCLQRGSVLLWNMC